MSNEKENWFYFYLKFKSFTIRIEVEQEKELMSQMHIDSVSIVNKN